MTGIDPNQTLFKSEYELELENWLRRRFRLVCIWYLILGGIVVIWRAIFIATQKENPGRISALIITVIAACCTLGTIIHFLNSRRWKDATREQLSKAAMTLIYILGGISLTKSFIIEGFSPESEYFLFPLFFWHFIACLFLPWSAKESLRAILPLMLIWMFGVIAVERNHDLTQRLITVIFGACTVIPGLVICAIRMKYHSETFRSRMVGQHFVSMRQEFARARSIHESMFPAPYEDGFIRFEYTYKPMRDIGGDYVHLHLTPEGLIHLTLIDVTGHGLAAALTVNRLYGELERIRAESPKVEPGEVLTLLNRYINLTMVKHNIYVTALCMTLDPYDGRLHWANAGHPPAYLRGANGVVKPLVATGVLLGALSSNEFICEQESIELSPGDVIVSYTDGAFEGRDRTGQQLGLKALGQLLHSQPPPRNWSQFIASAVERHNAGRSDDDVLVASITFKSQRPQQVIAKRALAAT